jgi:hypothetical protein
MKTTIFKIILVTLLAIFINSCTVDDGAFSPIKSESKHTLPDDNFSIEKSANETTIGETLPVSCPTSDHTIMIRDRDRIYAHNYNDSYTYNWEVEIGMLGGIIYTETGEYVQLPDIGFYEVTLKVSQPDTSDPVCAEVQSTEPFAYVSEPDDEWDW